MAIVTRQLHSTLESIGKLAAAWSLDPALDETLITIVRSSAHEHTVISEADAVRSEVRFGGYLADTAEAFGTGFADDPRSYKAADYSRQQLRAVLRSLAKYNGLGGGPGRYQRPDIRARLGAFVTLLAFQSRGVTRVSEGPAGWAFLRTAEPSGPTTGPMHGRLAREIAECAVRIAGPAGALTREAVERVLERTRHSESSLYAAAHKALQIAGDAGRLKALHSTHTRRVARLRKRLDSSAKAFALASLAPPGQASLASLIGGTESRLKIELAGKKYNIPSQLLRGEPGLSLEMEEELEELEDASDSSDVELKWLKNTGVHVVDDAGELAPKVLTSATAFEAPTLPFRAGTIIVTMGLISVVTGERAVIMRPADLREFIERCYEKGAALLMAAMRRDRAVAEALLEYDALIAEWPDPVANGATAHIRKLASLAEAKALGVDKVEGNDVVMASIVADASVDPYDKTRLYKECASASPETMEVRAGVAKLAGFIAPHFHNHSKSAVEGVRLLSRPVGEPRLSPRGKHHAEFPFGTFFGKRLMFNYQSMERCATDVQRSRKFEYWGEETTKEAFWMTCAAGGAASIPTAHLPRQHIVGPMFVLDHSLLDTKDKTALPDHASAPADTSLGLTGQEKREIFMKEAYTDPETDEVRRLCRQLEAALGPLTELDPAAPPYLRGIISRRYTAQVNCKPENKAKGRHFTTEEITAKKLASLLSQNEKKLFGGFAGIAVARTAEQQADDREAYLTAQLDPKFVAYAIDIEAFGHSFSEALLASIATIEAKFFDSYIPLLVAAMLYDQVCYRDEFSHLTVWRNVSGRPSQGRSNPMWSLTNALLSDYAAQEYRRRYPALLSGQPAPIQIMGDNNTFGVWAATPADTAEIRRTLMPVIAEVYNAAGFRVKADESFLLGQYHKFAGIFAGLGALVPVALKSSGAISPAFTEDHTEAADSLDAIWSGASGATAVGDDPTLTAYVAYWVAFAFMHNECNARLTGETLAVWLHSPAALGGRQWPAVGASALSSGLATLEDSLRTLGLMSVASRLAGCVAVTAVTARRKREGRPAAEVVREPIAWECPAPKAPQRMKQLARRVAESLGLDKTTDYGQLTAKELECLRDHEEAAVSAVLGVGLIPLGVISAIASVLPLTSLRSNHRQIVESASVLRLATRSDLLKAAGLSRKDLGRSARGFALVYDKLGPPRELPNLDGVILQELTKELMSGTGKASYLQRLRYSPYIPDQPITLDLSMRPGFGGGAVTRTPRVRVSGEAVAAKGMMRFDHSDEPVVARHGYAQRVEEFLQGCNSLSAPRSFIEIFLGLWGVTSHGNEELLHLTCKNDPLATLPSFAGGGTERLVALHREQAWVTPRTENSKYRPRGEHIDVTAAHHHATLTELYGLDEEGYYDVVARVGEAAVVVPPMRLYRPDIDAVHTFRHAQLIVADEWKAVAARCLTGLLGTLRTRDAARRDVTATTTDASRAISGLIDRLKAYPKSETTAAWDHVLKKRIVPRIHDEEGVNKIVHAYVLEYARRYPEDPSQARRGEIVDSLSLELSATDRTVLEATAERAYSRQRITKTWASRPRQELVRLLVSAASANLELNSRITAKRRLEEAPTIAPRPAVFATEADEREDRSRATAAVIEKHEQWRLRYKHFLEEHKTLGVVALYHARRTLQNSRPLDVLEQLVREKEGEGYYLRVEPAGGARRGPIAQSCRAMAMRENIEGALACLAAIDEIALEFEITYGRDREEILADILVNWKGFTMNFVGRRAFLSEKMRLLVSTEAARICDFSYAGASADAMKSKYLLSFWCELLGIAPVAGAAIAHAARTVDRLAAVEAAADFYTEAVVRDLETAARSAQAARYGTRPSTLGTDSSLSRRGPSRSSGTSRITFAGRMFDQALYEQRFAAGLGGGGPAAESGLVIAPMDDAEVGAAAAAGPPQDPEDEAEPQGAAPAAVAEAVDFDFDADFEDELQGLVIDAAD